MKKDKTTWMFAIFIAFAGIAEIAAGLKFMNDNLSVTLDFREIALYYVSVVTAVLVGILALFQINNKLWRLFWVSLAMCIVIAHYIWVTIDGVDGITWLVGFPVLSITSFFSLLILSGSIIYMHIRRRHSANK